MSRLARANSTADGLVALLGVALAALWIGLVCYFRQPVKKDAVTPGFDVKQVSDPHVEAPAAPSPPEPQTPSGLALVTDEAPPADAPTPAPSAAPAAPPPAPAHAAAAAPAADAASRFTDDFRRSFTQVRDLSYSYAKKYPSVARWARDWHDAPDLTRLNDQYLKDQDVVGFLKGLARAPSFPGMVRKYAGDPGIMAYIGGMVGQLPQVVGTGLSYAMNDALLKPFAEKTMSEGALPPGLTAAATAAGAGAASSASR